MPCSEFFFLFNVQHLIIRKIQEDKSLNAQILATEGSSVLSMAGFSIIYGYGFSWSNKAKGT